jgi:hypothetical protein
LKKEDERWEEEKCQGLRERETHKGNEKIIYNLKSERSAIKINLMAEI